MNGLLVKSLLYADDQVILASPEGELQQMVTIMNDAFKSKGIKVNVSKMTECNILKERVEQVKEFVYLGSMFTRDGKHSKDIERRVTAGNQVNVALLLL